MNASYIDIIRHHSRPLSPVATAATSKTSDMPAIRAVMFDIYGTLLISGSGDVGVSASRARNDAATAALRSVGVPDAVLVDMHETASKGGGPARCLIAAIEQDHARGRADGREHPEVDIVAIWRTVLNEIWPEFKKASEELVDLHRLAVEYEVRVNPVWIMPGLAETLVGLAGAGLKLGVISNAQFFTPLMFPALLDRTLEDLDFAPSMQYYSYRLGVAKPGIDLYRRAERELAEQGIGPREVLYVGNDMLNDMTPAAQCGFRTALFAGDQRSLRLREGDPRVQGIVPDLVVKDLQSILKCLLQA